MTEFFWAYLWPLIIIVAQSVLLMVILLVAIAYVHPQVARYRQQRNRSCCFHIVHHHQGVASLPANVALGANIVVVRIRRVGARARIGTNKQIVPQLYES